MNNRKTQRKNKTNQVINWPTNDQYFTIDSLINSNQHMLTSSGLDITLRVRLNKAINEEGMVAVIGHKNSGKGRPQLVFAMKPVNQMVLEKAKNDGIMLDMLDTRKLVSVVDVNSQTPTKTVSPVMGIPVSSNASVTI